MANSKQTESPKGQAYNIRVKVGDDDYVIFMGTTNNPLVSVISRICGFMNNICESTNSDYSIDAVNYEQVKNLNHESKT